MRRYALVICALLPFGPFGCSLVSRITGTDAKPAATVPQPSRAPWAQTTAAPSPEAPALLDTIGIDRVVVRWFAPETGGVAKLQFVFARELAFEARIEALTDPDPDGSIYSGRHVRSALDRHIAETLLASLPNVEAPTPAEIALRAENARAVMEQRVGGRDLLLEAARAEGLSSDELDTMLRRQAKASLYLDKMVAPMLEPTDLELRSLLRTGQTPFVEKDLDDASRKERVRRWYVGVRLAQALDTYYQNARSRVTIVSVKGL